ncbi:hypothetical protein [Pararhizobium sp.]|uniref:hypothetical protein n=1 Tax=Pararhizobium sp. TaxID=1977563 RepID=UPI003BA8E78A
MKRKFLVVALPLLASGCAATSPPDVGTADDSAISPAHVSPVTYTSPVSGYTHRSSADPKPWRDQNDAQAPQGDAP